ncbi:hypothetical protein LCGC14_1315760 [marine sediment metagenome]|uniref:Uncharacterized protein n=1 Tax=marine sediment metagenome TaxID=412755 RepID=A0A0F9KL42_9ZZZZ
MEKGKKMIYINYEQNNKLQRLIIDKDNYIKKVIELLKDETVIKIFIHKREDKQ